MLRSALLRNFGGLDSLLFWGDKGAAEKLHANLRAMRRNSCANFCLEGGPGLTCVEVWTAKGAKRSWISGTEECVVWECSQGVLSDVITLIESLISAESGHKYVEAQGGMAAQVIISVNEYPDCLLRD